MDEPPVLLSQLTRALATTPAREPLSLRLCMAFTELVGASGAALTIGFTGPDRVILCATDETSERVEDSQDVLREGPSLDAFRTAVAICGLTPDEQVRRWPMLADTLQTVRRGMVLHAFPIRPGSAALGVLTAYQTESHDLSRSCSEAQFLADAIGVAVLGNVRATEDAEEVWSVRDKVSQATGMVMAQLRIAPDDALALLRAHAFAHATTVSDVARAIVDRELGFSNDDGKGDE
jgi:hypothetical protein